MISEKMIELSKGNSAIRSMFEEGKKLKEKYGTENVYDFSLGNPNIPAPQAVKNAMIDVIEKQESTFVHGYMSNSGYEDVRAAVAESINGRFSTAFDEKNIIMTVGAAGGLNVILKTLLNPGDEVVTFAPYFLEYGNYVNNFGGILVTVSPDIDTFQPDAEKLAAKITSKTKAVIINNPNNPTGVVYAEETIRRLAEVLERRQRELGISIYLISDEPYRELVYEGAEVPYLTKYYRNTIVVYSWSKSLSLPGERIGYIVIPREIDDFQIVFDSAGIANRVLGFVNAPSFFQRVVKQCLNEKSDISVYDRNRKKLYQGLTKMGFECVYPQGAFYIWMKTPFSDIEFTEKAKKYNVLVVPGTSFACPGYVRIAYCVSERTIDQSLPAFEKLAGELCYEKEW